MTDGDIYERKRKMAEQPPANSTPVIDFALRVESIRRRRALTRLREAVLSQSPGLRRVHRAVRARILARVA